MGEGVLLVWNRDIKSYLVTCLYCKHNREFPYGYLDIHEKDRGGRDTRLSQAMAEWKRHVKTHMLGTQRVAEKDALTRAYQRKHRLETARAPFRTTSGKVE